MFSNDLIPSPAKGALATGWRLSFIADFEIPSAATYVVLHSQAGGYGRLATRYTSRGSMQWVMPMSLSVEVSRFITLVAPPRMLRFLLFRKQIHNEITLSDSHLFFYECNCCGKSGESRRVGQEDVSAEWQQCG